MDYPTPVTAPPSAPSIKSSRQHLNVPAKGRSAELRRASPAGRSSPLRQHIEIGDAAALSDSASRGTDHMALMTPPSPSHHDHHARAAKQGLPADAFVPPPTPPIDDYMFRRPVLDYFSSPEAKAALKRQEEVIHVPDHYQNSPLCPLHPKHRGERGDSCPIHGKRQHSSDGSIDTETLMGLDSSIPPSPASSRGRSLDVDSVIPDRGSRDEFLVTRESTGNTPRQDSLTMDTNLQPTSAAASPAQKLKSSRIRKLKQARFNTSPSDVSPRRSPHGRKSPRRVSPLSPGPSFRSVSDINHRGSGSGAYMLAGAFGGRSVTPMEPSAGPPPTFALDVPGHTRGDPRCPRFGEARMCVYHGRNGMGGDGIDSERSSRRRRRGSEESMVRGRPRCVCALGR